MAQQAWSFKAIAQDNLRYFGNDGYDDDSSEFYRYDSSVPNHKNVKVGDIAIITNRNNILGVSIIEKITERKIQKKRNKCNHPGCSAKKITPRKTLSPKWRCDNGHKFDEPRVTFEPAIEFIAYYGQQYANLKNIKMDTLITKTLKYNRQLSIQGINLSWALKYLNPQSSINPDGDAYEDVTGHSFLSDADLRRSVERQIKERRGQKSFRDQLLIINPVCAVTECSLVKILEAAHIDAYRNDTHNNIMNGVLLRSDIHTLFDLNLFAINPDTKTIHFVKEAIHNGYAQYEGALIKSTHELSKQALTKRWELFITKNKIVAD
ncbi:HNH endonuclease signature motif containing protein [Lelliottia amnigena]|jgi:hypothetical protein|uniref:HNH endonuclease n=1 Tax=Lelliottia amnigena TaxID=61646 RepID=UPI00301A17A0